MEKHDAIERLNALLAKIKEMPFEKGKSGLIRKCNDCIDHLNRYKATGTLSARFVKECEQTYARVFGGVL